MPIEKIQVSPGLQRNREGGLDVPEVMVLKTSPVVVFQILIVASQEAEATLPEVSVVELPSEDMTVISSFRSTQSDEIHPL
jgi:hypothetical protein